MHHRVNHPSVISESLDGEVVIIALATGTYYNLRGASAYAWDALAAGAPEGAVADGLAAAFTADGVDVAAALTAFAAELRAEALLVPGDGEPAAPSLPEAPEGRPPWEPLVLETFTDMQQLILLDPVHEVEPTRGWPVANDQAAEPG